MSRQPRSYLYVPGIDTRRMAKAMTVGADAIILDLEDAVPVHRKAEGVSTVRSWLNGLNSTVPDLWVRVNSGPAGLDDLNELRGCSGLRGFVLAKASLEQVRLASERVARTGLELAPLLETAESVLEAREIAEAGVQHLQIGEYDLCADVGISPGGDEREMDWARSVVVFSSRAAGLMPPVAPVSIEIRDTERFARSTRLAARQGFIGRACIHPAQVQVVNAVFTPTEAEVDAARKTLDRFGSLAGSAVMLDEQGRLVDEATIRAARRTLATSGAVVSGDAS